MRKSPKNVGIPFLIAALTVVLVTTLPATAAPLSSHVELTLKATPDHPVIGQETQLAITLRSKDQQPIAGATVLVAAEMLMAQPSMAGMQHGHMATAPNDKAQLAVTAKPSDKPGEYLAALRLTDEGDWKITATSGDAVAELRVTAIKGQTNAGQRAAPDPAPAQTGQGVPVKVASASAKASSMEAVHASYLELTGNIGDLRARVAQWKQGDEGSLNIAKEKLERIRIVLGSITWPEAMAKAVLTTAEAIRPLAKALEEEDLAAAEPVAKALGDGSHDVTHAFYGDWLPSIEGTRFSPMAPHAIYLDLNLNVGDLRARVAQWEKGDEGSLNIAKEKAERTGVLIPHMTPYGVMLKPLQALEKGLPAVVAALERKNVAAAQEALKPIAEASHDLTHDFYQWMEVSGGGNDAACVPASYRDLTLNIADLRARVGQWQQGDEASYNIAGEKLERIEAVLAHPTWPGEMAKAIGRTETAVKAMAEALKAKDVAGAEAASKALGDGSHEVTHDYFESWLPSVQLGADEGQVAARQGKTVAKGHDDGHGAAEEAAGPNYYFVGSTLGVVLITIALVPILRRRDLQAQRVEEA